MEEAAICTPQSVDPLRQHLALPLNGEYHPLGFAVEIATNSPEVLRAAECSWGDFEPYFRGEPLRLRIAVDREGPAGRPAAPCFRGQGHLLTVVSDAGNYAVCDHTRGFGFCWLTPGGVADADWLRFYFLDALVYSLLAQICLVPAHAACVSRGGCGVLLTGVSGAGKSSLAFACASKGWTFVSDDASYLLRDAPDCTVIGRPFQFRFRESAGALFPELALRFVGRTLNGKPAMEVRTSDLPGIQTARRASVRHVIFLHRDASDPARLVPVPAAEALERLLRFLPLYDPAVLDWHESSLRRLCAVGAFELRYQSLGSAVARLDRLVEEGE